VGDPRGAVDDGSAELRAAPENPVPAGAASDTVTLLRDTRDDLAALVGRAAERLGMDPAFVEKDYWVTELLRSLAKPLAMTETAPAAQVVVFKGGTSLSKAYGLIGRFSEDVDILVTPRAGFGRGATDKLLKGLVDRASADLGLEPGAVTSTTGVKRNVEYAYPCLHATSVLRSVLLLEMGIRGGAQPSSDVAISSHVAELAVEIDPGLVADDLTPFSIRVLGPERTLVEKLQLVHTAAVRAAEEPLLLERSGRHFYDIWRLLTADSVMVALAEYPSGVPGLAEDIHRRSRAAGFPSVLRPAGGYAVSPAFVSGELMPTIRNAYRNIAPLVWGALPSIEAVVAKVADSAARL